MTLPPFPEFAPLELSHRGDVARITSPFPPYSDFNFTGLWVWDVQGETAVSEHRGNLVLRGADYLTGEPYYSFIGQDEIGRALADVCRLAAEDGTPLLRLVPGAVLDALADRERFVVNEDRDNHDYVYCVPAIAELRGRPFANIRQWVNRFRRRFGEAAEVVQLDLTDPAASAEIMDVFSLWQSSRERPDEEVSSERQAICRLLAGWGALELVALGVRIAGKLAAFSICEVVGRGWAISHFEKADASLAGLFAFTSHSEALHLASCGVARLNVEQDLGLPGLRAAKRALPHAVLKKYTVTMRDIR